MMPEQQHFIHDFSHQLGLRWPVDVRYAAVQGPQIEVDREKQIHHIAIPGRHIHAGSNVDCDFAHELIHGFYAERLDPIFATVYFPQSSDTGSALYQRNSKLVYWSQQFVDVWVTDKMYQVDKKLAKSETEGWLNDVLKHHNRFILENPENILFAYALSKASIQRQNFRDLGRKAEQVGKRIKQLFGKENLDLAERLSELFTQLPKLRDNRDEALQMFEEYAQKTASLLGFPIHPTIADDIDGKKVWRW